MRTILFMVLALAAVAGGFVLYVKLQPPIARGPEKADDGPGHTFARDVTSAGAIGPGSRPRFKAIDSQRRLSYTFRADDYESKPGNRILVRKPEVEFYQYINEKKDDVARVRTQRVRLVGKTGTVEFARPPAEASATGIEPGPTGPPRRGVLYDVTIEVVPDVKPNGVGERVSTTMVMPNVAFDNETFEITTQSYQGPDGATVPADQVPVVATGDYEFVGRGLTLRWNDVDGRLELLEIAHGDYLQVNDLDALGKGGLFDGGSTASPTTAPTTAPVAWDGDADARGRFVGPLRDERGVPIELAAADRPTAAKAGNKGKPKPTTKPKRPPQPPYRATFDQDVRVSQGKRDVAETTLATADVMHLDFQSAAKGPTTKPTTKPATKPAADPATQATTPAATNPTSKPASRPSTGPATKPAPEPLIVRWSGKLRVVPLDALDGSPMTQPATVPAATAPSSTQPAEPAKGQTVVRFEGTTKPVVLTRGFGRVECTEAAYYSVDGSTRVRGSEQFGQVVLRQFPDPAAAPGAVQDATVVTDALDYAGTEKMATLKGRSRATVVLPGPATKPTTTGPATNPATAPAVQVVDVRWNRLGQLFFKDGPTGSDGKQQMDFDRANFSGDVDVRHPQLSMKSQDLDLTFGDPPADAATTRPTTAKPATKPSKSAGLREMVATTDVWCDLVGADGKRQTVTTDKLTVRTASDADGKMYPKVVTANGGAHAFDDQQDLRAGNVELTLVPAPKPATRPTTGPATLPTTVPATNPAKEKAAVAGVDAATGQIDAAAVELETMRAWDGVTVRTADGAMASGDRMDVKVVDGRPIARIVGAPLAVVTDAKNNVISGPAIHVDAARQFAAVEGKGSIKAVQAPEKPTTKPATRPTTVPATQPASTQPDAKPAKPDRVVDIDWETGAELDGARNEIRVAGPVLVRTVDEDGSVVTARGQNALIELADRPPPATQPVATTLPTTQPATKPTTRRSTTKPSTKPAGAAGLVGTGGMDVFKDKVVTAVNLTEKAALESTLSDEVGILRQFQIKSEIIRFETGDDGKPAATQPTSAPSGSPLAMGSDGRGRMIVPGPGTLLYRDHRPTSRPTTGPATGPSMQRTKPTTEPASPGGFGGQRGTTAFKWDKSMVVDQAARRAVMDGNVVIANRGDAPDAEVVHVTGDRAIALFSPKEPATKPATVAAKPTKPPAESEAQKGEPAVQLRWMTIDGNLVVRRGESTLSANRLDYDPATGWMAASGTARNPAVFQGGVDQVLADQIYWNTQTWMTEFVNIRGRGGVQR